MAGDPFDGGGEIFGRHVQTFGIVAHVAFCTADAGAEQCHKLFHNKGRAVGVGCGVVTLGVGFEDFVHHSQAEAAHQLLVAVDGETLGNGCPWERLLHVLDTIREAAAFVRSKRYNGLAVKAQNRLRQSSNGLPGFLL